MDKYEAPEAIIVTLPARYFKEYDHESYLKELSQREEDTLWFRICKNLPKQDVLFVYTIIDNKIHHRSNFVGIERNNDYKFYRPDGTFKEFKKANAILTCGPVILAPHVIEMRGFQGFRYSKKLF